MMSLAARSTQSYARIRGYTRVHERNVSAALECVSYDAVGWAS